MDKATLRDLLARVQRGELQVDDAARRLEILPFEDLGFAKLDHHRGIRDRAPEVVYTPGKTTEQVLAILARLAEHGRNVMATRVEPAVAEAVLARFPGARHDPQARIVVVNPAAHEAPTGQVAVISAGTADLPVAEEAALTAELLGSRVTRLHDVGVAGIHRLLAHVAAIREARVLVVVAGMEGALPSVVAGLVERPVIAVPTSVGYGASFGGLAALLAMLNSCALGVTVVNIDNGFGAGYQAHLINQPAAEAG